MLTKEEIFVATEYAKKNGVKAETIERTTRVAQKLLEKGLPREGIIGEILKEINKTKTNYSQIEKKFGEKVAQKTMDLQQLIEVLEKNYGKIQDELLSSILLSIPKDLQSIIVILADQTELIEIGNCDKEKAQMIEKLLCPMALKLGLTNYVTRIQDGVFKITNPEEYQKIAKLINKPQKEREQLIEEIKEEIKKLLEKKFKIEISGRPKTIKAIHEKMKKKLFEQIYDIYGVRIICNKEKECYEILGEIHSKYQNIPQAFDDYIAKPKKEGYKSIHTAIKIKNHFVEVQIRTWQHQAQVSNEIYWNYKKILKDKEFEKEISIEKQLLDWQIATGKEVFNKKISGRKIFIFTPKNEVIPLPIDSTAIDFAYAIHTGVGEKMLKAKINGKLSPIETKLKNLDKVEIILAKTPQVKKEWLANVVTPKAKTKIRSELHLTEKKEPKKNPCQNPEKKIKIAECCHPLPGEDVIGVKTTKRKIVLHKATCQNLKKIPKNKLINIMFEQTKGKSEIKIKAMNRPGLITEILEEIRKNGAETTDVNFKIKKTGYLEAIFKIEAKSAKKVEQLIEELIKIKGIQNAER